MKKTLIPSTLAVAALAGLFCASAAGASDPALQGKKVLLVVQAQAREKADDEPLRKLPVPVLTCQPELLGDLGMTGPRQDADYGVFEKKDHYLYVVNAPHPLAAGLPAGTFVSSGKSVPMNWGKPSLAANVAVTPPG